MQGEGLLAPVLEFGLVDLLILRVVWRCLYIHTVGEEDDGLSGQAGK